jgi:hypothetical protein
MDPQGRRSPYEAQSYVVSLSDPRPSGHRGTPPALHRRNDTSGQRGLSCREDSEGHTLLVQRQVYFISEVLSETKVRYPQI